MAAKNTYYFVIGGSLGGGEFDCIMRSSKNSSKIVYLVENPAKSFIECCEKNSIKAISISMLNREREEDIKSSIFIFNSFIRDIFLIFKLYSYKSKYKVRFKVVVHSDPMRTWVDRSNLSMYIIAKLYDLCMSILCDSARFVSRKQLKSFKSITRKLPYYIERPISKYTNHNTLLDDKVKTNLGDSNKYKVCFVGRLAVTKLMGDAKGLKFLSSLVKALDFSLVDFTIGGEGPHLECLRRELSGFPVTFSNSSNIIATIQESDCVIVPSEHEGYCLVALESLCQNKKVISSPVIATELHNRDGIEIINEKNVLSWKRAIENNAKKHIIDSADD